MDATRRYLRVAVIDVANVSLPIYQNPDTHAGIVVV